MNWRTDLENVPIGIEFLVRVPYFDRSVYYLANWDECLESICTWDQREDGPVALEDVTHWCEIIPPNTVE